MNKLAIMAISASIAASAYASEAVGFFSNGRILDSVSVTTINSGIRKLFTQRSRYYGTVELIDVIEDLTRYMKATESNPEVLQIGDLSNLHGGITKEHASHQNGLDVDIVYLTHNRKLQKTNATFWQEEFVVNGKVTNNFDAKRNLELFKYAVENHPIRRIFVDEAIKKHLCSYAKTNNLLSDRDYVETLRRLRISKLHTNHFHIRITCPVGDNKCVEQDEVPAGSGC